MFTVVFLQQQTGRGRQTGSEILGVTETTDNVMDVQVFLRTMSMYICKLYTQPFHPSDFFRLRSYGCEVQEMVFKLLLCKLLNMDS